jgi:hypothetical protein
LFPKVNFPNQPQPFGVKNEMENPKGADMKPPWDYLSLGGNSIQIFLIEKGLWI